MSLDYLDLLLMRETRAAPLAEPRIEPAPVAASPGPSPAWDEVVEEREAPIVPSLPEQEQRAEGELRRRGVEPQVQAAPAVFPPPLDRLLEQPAVPEPQRPARSVRAVAEDDRQAPSAPRRVQPPELIGATVTTIPAMNPPDAAEASGEAPMPPRMRPPDEPREIATRRASPAPTLAVEPPPAAPVTIRIDRVEVRAASAARPAAPAGPRPRPRVTLEEFLTRRSGSRRE